MKSRHRKSRRSDSNRQLANFLSLENRLLLATFTVTNTAPSGPGSLPQVVIDANNSTGADTINFDATVFTGGDNSLIRLTEGELEVTEALTISAPSSLGVTITGDADGDDITTAGNITDVFASFGGTKLAVDDLLDDNSRVLHFTAETGGLTIEGLTITGGNGGRTTFNSDAGGAIFSTGSVTINDSDIVGNQTLFASGGGISAGSVTLNNSTVSGNQSLFRPGGGISAGTVVLNNSTVSGNTAVTSGGGISAGGVTLTNSTISGNTVLGSTAGYGGGISADTVVLNNTTVSGNTINTGSYYGGGSPGRGGGISSIGAVTLTNSTISGNTVNSSGSGVGGGIHTSQGPLTINDSRILDNTINSVLGFTGGGGISVSGSASLTNTTVAGNSSKAGGGIYASSGGTVQLLNSTVSGNSGGGIGTFTGNVTLTNSTISGNTGYGIGAKDTVQVLNSTVSGNSGAGIQIWRFGDDRPASLTIRNSIIAGNSNADFVPPISVGSVLTVESSIIGDSTGTTLTAGNNNQLNVDFTSVLETEVVDGVTVPLLTDNGGSVETIALLAGSPAIDSGDNSLAVDANGNPLTTDQRGTGFDRIFSGTVDIGAFESPPSPFLLGDANQDGVVDFADIPSFIDVLISGDFLDEADINGDGVVDFADIPFFIDLLISQ